MPTKIFFFFYFSLFLKANELKNFNLTVQSAKNGEKAAMIKIFDYNKKLDGMSATEYQNSIDDIFKKNPVTYILSANEFYKGNMSCAVFLIANESSNTNPKEIKQIVDKIKNKTKPVIKFKNLLNKQLNYLLKNVETDYVDCNQ